MEEIKTYLAQKDRDYDKGLLLLSKHGKNRILSNRLARKPWVEKLEYELQKLVNRSSHLVVMQKQAKENHEEDQKKEDFEKSLPKLIPVNRTFVVKGKQTVSYNDLPLDLAALWDDNAEMYKHSRSLHEKLKLMHKADPEDRIKPLTDLLNLQKKIRANWDIIDKYDPSLVVSKNKTADKPIDAKRISANRAYISRNIKNITAGNKDDKFHKLQSRVSELVSAGEGFKDSQRKILVDFGFLYKNPS